MTTTSKNAWTRRKLIASAFAVPALATTPASAGIFSDLFFGKDNKEETLEVARTLTTKLGATTYNNAYEFGTRKTDPAKHGHKLLREAWTVEIEGTTKNDGTYDVAELRGTPFSHLPDVERRMRCVEAWSMVIPWNGIPLGDIIKKLEPLGSAKYVNFECVSQSGLPGQDSVFSSIPWPYVESVRMDEAMNPLALATFGAYGDEDLPQNGMPLKINFPWKYGFKSPKFVTKITFSETRGGATWHDLAPREYGWYSNVNPDANHPRWSQATERRIWDEGDIERIPTQILNGYAEEVGYLYKDQNVDYF